MQEYFFFNFIGVMVFYSVEFVTEEIRINALVLGSLSFLVGILFFLDDCLTAKGFATSNKLTQTEKIVGSKVVFDN